MESLGYMLVYFARGSLPWQGLKAANDDERNEQIKNKKVTLSAEELCEGLPGEFAWYIKQVRSLGFGDRPDYARLRKAFRDLFTRKGFAYDNVYDWTLKKFHEIHGIEAPAAGHGARRSEMRKRRSKGKGVGRVMPPVQASTVRKGPTS